MKRYGNLFERVVTFENFHSAAFKAFQGKRTRPHIARFHFHLEKEIIHLMDELLGARYCPRPYGIFEIRDPKVRQICSSDFRDRVVHHAICNILEPIVDNRLIFDTYACRKNKGSHAAIKRARYYVGRSTHFLKYDIKKYFPSIDHGILKRILRSIIKDRRFMSLLDVVIDHQVPGSPLGKGLPIGNLTSQYFANLYLSPLDRFIENQLGAKHYIRYMDDFILFEDSKYRLCELSSQVERFLWAELQLQLKERATTLAPVTEGVPFLGFRVFNNLIRLQRPNLVRFRRRLRKRERAYRCGHIDEQELVKSVSSMVAHIQHADTMRVRRKVFEGSLRLA